VRLGDTPYALGVGRNLAGDTAVDAGVEENRRADHAGAERRDSDSVVARLDSQRAAEPDDAVLGGAVHGGDGCGDEARHGSGRDEMPCPTLDHARVERMKEVDHAHQVHVDDVAPVVVGVLERLAAHAGTGVREREVDAAAARP
jgi:hypothetical protein